MNAQAHRVRFGLGYSTCPNDTFMFDALVHGRVDDRGLSFDPVLEDIEALNQRAHSDQKLPFTKLSVAALAGCTGDYAACRAGAALGRGCGPLVVARTPKVELGGSETPQTVLVPGLATTAVALYRILVGGAANLVPERFDRIMTRVAAGEADAGLIIHESRFTYGDYGLHQIVDLGEAWEAATGLPIPLGVIAARRSLGEQVHRAFEDALSDSVRFAFEHPEASASYVAQHAQEIDAQVCQKHIELYVNSFSEDLGRQGRRAIDEFFLRGRACGALPAGPSPWM